MFADGGDSLSDSTGSRHQEVTGPAGRIADRDGQQGFGETSETSVPAAVAATSARFWTSSSTGSSVESSKQSIRDVGV